MPDKVARKIFEKIQGEVCWEVFYERINLSFKFGEPRLVIHEDKIDPILDRKIRCLTGVKSEWFFWVTYGRWKLTVLNYSRKKIAATNYSTKNKKRNIIRFLWGQRLVRFEFDSKTNETKLLFDLDAELIITPPRNTAKEIWTLYEPNGYCLRVYGNGEYDYGATKDLRGKCN